ncbi:unnamed protein product [Cuscuta europaea]|uniref:Uncharacterized protein n=1 Tax=Cuscuta europaea TaxID=41803 RepID=A0A9P0YY86_CUSEU|nr:unnamed protein product [Cuscuta europaea]
MQSFDDDTTDAETTTASNHSRIHRGERGRAHAFRGRHHTPSDHTPTGSRARGDTPVGRHFRYGEHNNTRFGQRRQNQRTTPSEGNREFVNRGTPPPPPLTAQEEEMAEMRRQMNGQPCGFFKPQRGVKQGDPYPPTYS